MPQVLTRLFPTLLAFITLIFMFCSDSNPSLKFIAGVLCVATSVTYFFVHFGKLYGPKEWPAITLVCGSIWLLNAFIQFFLWSAILTRV